MHYVESEEETDCGKRFTCNHLWLLEGYEYTKDDTPQKDTALMQMYPNQNKYIYQKISFFYCQKCLEITSKTTKKEESFFTPKWFLDDNEQ